MAVEEESVDKVVAIERVHIVDKVVQIEDREKEKQTLMVEMATQTDDLEDELPIVINIQIS